MSRSSSSVTGGRQPVRSHSSSSGRVTSSGAGERTCVKITSAPAARSEVLLVPGYYCCWCLWCSTHCILPVINPVQQRVWWYMLDLLLPNACPFFILETRTLLLCYIYLSFKRRQDSACCPSSKERDSVVCCSAGLCGFPCVCVCVELQELPSCFFAHTLVLINPHCCGEWLSLLCIRQPCLPPLRPLPTCLAACYIPMTDCVVVKCLLLISKDSAVYPCSIVYTWHFDNIPGAATAAEKRQLHWIWPGVTNIVLSLSFFFLSFTPPPFACFLPWVNLNTLFAILP